MGGRWWGHVLVGSLVTASLVGSRGEELRRRGGEEDIALGRDEHQFRHDHGLDKVAVDDKTHLDRVGREGQDVREGAH